MKFYMTLIMTVLGLGLIIGAAPAQNEIDYTEMVEDLKVMCRIIDDTLNDTFEKDYLKGGFFGRRGCQHLYLKGYGVVFLLDVRFPVAEKEMKVVKTEKETNLWEKYEREVRHQRQPEEAVWVVDKNESYNKEKVDKLKEKLAYLVGEYGVRIGQLAFDDMVSFVVFGQSGHTVDFDNVLVDFDNAFAARKKMIEVEREILEEEKEIRELEREIREEEREIHELEREIHEEELEEIEGEEGRDDDEAVIIKKGKKIIVEGEIVEEMEGSQPKKRRRIEIRIPTPPLPPVPPYGFHGKPATTLILTFNRSQLEGKKGSDWEALLTAAHAVQY